MNLTNNTTLVYLPVFHEMYLSFPGSSSISSCWWGHHHWRGSRLARHCTQTQL